MKIFITGIAGFIGYHTAKRYIADGHNVIGIDNLNSSYSVDLKSDRIQNLYELGMPKKNFKLGDINLTDIIIMLCASISMFYLIEFILIRRHQVQ